MTTINDRDHFVQTYSIDTISGSTRIDTVLRFMGVRETRLNRFSAAGHWGDSRVIGVIPYNQALLRTLAGGFKHFLFSPIIVG